MPGTSKSSQYRQKMKDDNPLKYFEYLEKQRIRNLKNRNKLKKEMKKKKPSEEAKSKKSKQLDQQKKRQKEYVARKKSEDINWKPKQKIEDPQQVTVTRNTTKSLKEYNRNKKQKELENMSYQNKMWVRKKDRERKAAKRRQKAIEKAGEQDEKNPDDSFSSKQTEYNITTKVKSSMPKNPSKYAKIVRNLVENASPRKRKYLDNIGVSGKKTKFDVPAELKQTTEGRSALKIVAKSLVNVSRRMLSERFKLNRRTISRKISRMKSKRTKVSEQEIRDFYKREDVSRILPQMRYATKDGPGYGMQISVKAAHAKYLSENPDKYISLGKFAFLRQRNVRLLSKTHREYCACVYCINVRYKLLVLSRAVNDVTKKKTGERDILDILLCEKSDSHKFHKADCINGQCTICHNYEETLMNYYKEIPDDKVLRWSRWEKITDSITKKVKREVVTKAGNKTSLLQELVSEDIMKPVVGTTFIKHIHNADWQNKQFDRLKTTLPQNWTLQVIDFSKNRGVKYQDEVKSVFFSPEQITMHPIVTYYRSKAGLMRHSVIILSEDCLHDYHAVRHYTNLADKHIEKSRGIIPSQKVVFSDGCSSQYKSKGPFADLSLNNEIEINRNYFGSEHGKGDADGETGVINRAVDRAIIGNQVVINNAQDMYKYCKDNLELDDTLSKRQFILVKKGEINRKRPETEVKPVPKTRKIHQVLNHKNESYKLQSRNLSCFCNRCMQNDYDNCSNQAYVSKYTTNTLVCLKKNIPSVSPATSISETLPSRKVSEILPTRNVSETLPTQKISETLPTQKISETLPTQKISETLPTQNESERDAFFIRLQQRLLQCTTFDEFQAECTHALPLIEEYDIFVKHDLSIVEGKRKIDKASMELLPDEMSRENRYPVEVYGDGNCLPRCGSVFTGLSHTEIRVRIAVEGALFEEMYLDKDYLTKGLSDTQNKGNKVSLASLFAQYSDEFDPSAVLTRAVQIRIFRKEIMEIIKPGKYMGIWQLFCLASVLKSPIRSVYPLYGSEVVRKDLDRIITPRINQEYPGNPLCIMWSHIHGCQVERLLWRPNHFVVILPIDNTQQQQFDVVLDSDPETDDWNIRVSEILDQMEAAEGRQLIDISLEYPALEQLLMNTPERQHENDDGSLQPDDDQPRRSQSENDRSVHPQSDDDQPKRPQPEDDHSRRPRPDDDQPRRRPQPEDDHSRRPQPNDDQSRRPQPDDGQSRRPQTDDDQLRRPQPNDDQHKSLQPDDDQSRRPQPDDEQLRRPQPDDDQPRRPQPDDDQSRRPKPGEEQLRRLQPDDNQSRRPLPDDEQLRRPQPEDDNQPRRPEHDDDLSRHPQTDDDQLRRPQPNDDQHKSLQPDDDQSRRPQPDDEQLKRPEPDDDQPRDDQPTNKQISGIKGSYIAVKCGNAIYPAVVEEWPAVVFYIYCKREEMWVSGTVTHIADDEDKMKELATPTKVKKGFRRLYFNFHEEEFKYGPLECKS